MAPKTTLNDVMDGLATVLDELGNLKARLDKVEARKPPNGNGRRKSAKPTGSDNFTVIEPTANCKYRRYHCWYVVDGKDPFEKTFYGRKKMASFDWGLAKLYGSFRKYTDMPSV